MQCLTQLVPPTAVNASISIPFLSATANNLIVAKSSLVQIFAPKSVVTEIASDDNQQPQQAVGNKKERVYTTKLVLISQFHVSGTVTDLARVKTIRSKSGGELLLIALRDAKLSLAEWDPEKHSISTVSIHYYEREDLQGAPWALSLSQCANFLTVDAGSRCAAFKFGPRNLAILPFHQAGDDLVIDDLDIDADSRQAAKGASKNQDDAAPPSSTPYASSFVLSLLALDPALKFPIHLAFLQGYREPTLAVISSQVAVSASLLHERKDTVSLTVYTLDLEQRASTTLLSVTNLPYDIHRIYPLPPPIGGALLFGYNEIIHVDQAGKANGLAVNEFAKQCTSFSLVQQTDLAMKLEDCVVEQLSGSTGKMLIVLNTGELAILGFKLDGRTVSGLDVQRIPAEKGGAILSSMASCASIVGRGRIFIGSEDADSVVVGWSSKASKSAKQRPKTTNGAAKDEVDLNSEEEGEEDDEENDLYAESKPDDREATKLSGVQTSEDFAFRVHDTLTNLSPLHDVRIIRREGVEKSLAQSSYARDRLDLLATTGRGSKSSLVQLCPEVHLTITESFYQKPVARAWSLFAQSGDASDDTSTEVHNILVTSTDVDADGAESYPYRLVDGKLEELNASDFETDAGGSVEVASFLGNTRVLQVLIGEVRVFDADLNLTQIIPLSDDLAVTASDVPAPTDFETPTAVRRNNAVSPPHVIAASIVEPYVLLVRNDNSIVLLQADDSGDLEELEKGKHLSGAKWVSGSLYDDVNDAFHLEDTAEEEEEYSSMLMFLLNLEGGLQIFRLPRLQEPVYTAHGLGLLPPYLSQDFNIRRASAKGVLDEILVAELGDSTYKSPSLILRSVNDDLIVYSPYQDTSKRAVNKSLQFRKISHPFLPKAPPTESETSISRAPLRVVNDSQGRTYVVAPGFSTSIIVKTAHIDPVVLSVAPGCLRSASPTITEDGSGIAFVDSYGSILLAHLPADADYTCGWVCQKLLTGSRISGFVHHERTDRLVVGMSVDVPYRLPEDELHPEWLNETTNFLPTMEQDTVALVDPGTLSITDTLDLEPQEVVMCMESMSLEVSESTHEKRSLVCIGTAITRGEDINTFGCIYVIDIIEVVPEPDRPETGRRFKVLSKIRDKGAVTAITRIGSEGFLLVSHGQKCFVRGLKEDGTLLPVAFIDTQGYVSVAKELPRTGLTLLADAMKGIWLVGYTEDPYHLKLFGKAANHLQVIAADFLPDRKDLYIPVIDSEQVLHIFQYDPANPKSLAGHNLLHLSSLFAGVFPSGMALVLRTQTSWEKFQKSMDDDDGEAMETDAEEEQQQQQRPEHQVLIYGTDGSISVLTPLTSQTYRALGALQSYLNTTLPHPFGLNPKAYRNVDADLSVGGRAVLDGNVLSRWMELGTWKRSESVLRAGLEAEWELRAMLDVVGGRGLGYL